MVGFMLASLIVSLWYKGPIERLINMILELQIMANFALLSITLPANYLVMSAIMKPYVSLNILRSYVGSESQKIVSSDLSLEDLSYLGQRREIGYVSYNLF